MSDKKAWDEAAKRMAGDLNAQAAIAEELKGKPTDELIGELKTGAAEFEAVAARRRAIEQELARRGEKV